MVRDEHAEVLVHEPGDHQRLDRRDESAEPGIRVGAAPADQDELAVGREHAAHLEHAAIDDVVHDDVVLAAALREIIARVVDDVVGTERADQLDVPRAAYTRHLGAQRLGDLHGKRADAARGAIDQHFLPGLERGAVAQRLQRREARHVDGGRLLEADTRRLPGQVAVFGDGQVFGERTVAAAEDFVAGLELRDARADGLDRAGEVDADARIFRRAESEIHADHVGRAAHEMPVGGIDAGRAYLDEHAALRQGTGFSMSSTVSTSGGP